MPDQGYDSHSHYPQFGDRADGRPCNQDQERTGGGHFEESVPGIGRNYRVVGYADEEDESDDEKEKEGNQERFLYGNPEEPGEVFIDSVHCCSWSRIFFGNPCLRAGHETERGFLF